MYKKPETEMKAQLLDMLTVHDYVCLSCIFLVRIFEKPVLPKNFKQSPLEWF